MRYDLFRAAGYPIGSGTVESACKHVVQQRLKQSGMRWSRQGAQAMLALRSTLLSQHRLNSLELLGLAELTNNLGYTRLYRSRDRGMSWTFLTHVNHCFAANLFTHRGAVYLLGMDRRFGSICIRRSDDGGNTWSRLAPEGSDPAQMSVPPRRRSERQRNESARAACSKAGQARTCPTITARPCRFWRAAGASTGHSRTVRLKTGRAFTPILRSEKCRRS